MDNQKETLIQIAKTAIETCNLENYSSLSIEDIQKRVFANWWPTFHEAIVNILKTPEIDQTATRADAYKIVIDCMSIMHVNTSLTELSQLHSQCGLELPYMTIGEII